MITTAIITAMIYLSGSEVACSDGSQRPHLIAPYTLDANDMRFATAQGFNTAEQFYTYLKTALTCYTPRVNRTEDDVRGNALPTAWASTAVSARCSVSSIISSSTTRCGSAPGSRLPTTGAKPIRIAGSLLPLSLPSFQGEGSPVALCYTGLPECNLIIE